MKFNNTYIDKAGINLKELADSCKDKPVKYSRASANKIIADLSWLDWPKEKLIRKLKNLTTGNLNFRKNLNFAFGEDLKNDDPFSQDFPNPDENNLKNK